MHLLLVGCFLLCLLCLQCIPVQARLVVKIVYRFRSGLSSVLSCMIQI